MRERYSLCQFVILPKLQWPALCRTHWKRLLPKGSYEGFRAARESSPREMELNSHFRHEAVCQRHAGSPSAIARSAHICVSYVFPLHFVVTCGSNQHPDPFWISHTCFARVLPPHRTLPLKARLPPHH